MTRSIYATNDEALIKLIAKVGMVRWSDDPITFKSGIRSHIYVSGRNELTSNRTALRAVGSMIAQMAQEATRHRAGSIHLIGIPTAGTPLAAAGAALSDKEDPIGCRTMREVKKGHGANHRWIDGEPNPDETYMTVDNVITDGQSKLETIERLHEDGYPVDNIYHLILIDRKQGGVEMLREQGHKVLTRIDLPTVVQGLVLLGFWSKERLRRYQTERAEWMPAPKP